jgi:phage baseplate assembly protein W
MACLFEAGWFLKGVKHVPQGLRDVLFTAWCSDVLRHQTSSEYGTKLFGATTKAHFARI